MADSHPDAEPVGGDVIEEAALPWTVFMVEDSPAMRARIEATLEPASDVRIVGWAAGAAEALAGIRSTRPHVTVLDLRLAQGRGLDVLRGIAHERLNTRVIVFAGDLSDAHRTAALRAGASAVLDKAGEPARLLDAIRALGRSA